MGGSNCVSESYVQRTSAFAELDKGNAKNGDDYLASIIFSKVYVSWYLAVKKIVCSVLLLACFHTFLSNNWPSTANLKLYSFTASFFQTHYIFQVYFFVLCVFVAEPSYYRRPLYMPNQILLLCRQRMYIYMPLRQHRKPMGNYRSFYLWTSFYGQNLEHCCSYIYSYGL